MSVLDNIKNIFAQRRSGDPRYPSNSRVAAPYRTASSVSINPDSALTLATTWACLRYLTQTTAALPWHVMRSSAEGSEKVTDHPIDYLIHRRASPEWSSFQFRETMLHWALRWGNGYAEIEPNALNRPTNLWPIHPERVQVCRDPDTKAIYYEVDGQLEFTPSEIFHLRGFGEGPVGLNVVQYAAQSLGWAAAVQLFGASFFGNGMNVSGVIKTKRQLSIPAHAALKKELESLYKGVRNSNRALILDADMDWEQVSISPDKAQFLLTNEFLVNEICRWFGVPPHKVQHLTRATFSNIEHQAIEVVVDSISPWAKRFEDEADFKLFGQNRTSLYTKMNLNALMRGDVQARGSWYKMMREIGAFSINDILRLEDMNTIGPDGDKRVMQSQFTTLEQIGMEPVTKPSPASPASAASTGKQEQAMADSDRQGAIDLNIMDMTEAFAEDV